MKVQRFDKMMISDSSLSRTKEGYLTVKAPVTLPGVFPYKRNDGGLSFEAKLPEELFSDETIQSVNNKPVTNDHPNEQVTINNYNTYAKGMTANDAAVEDDKLTVSFTVTDADTIRAIEQGKRELSLGFEADVEKTAGEFEGKRYDSVQRNIRVNHLAIVQRGRVGPSASIRGDSLAFMIDEYDIEGGNTMVKVKIDSEEFTVDSAVKSHIDALEAKLEKEEEKAKDAEKTKGERDSLKSQLEEKEKELKEAKDSALTADKLDEAVEGRMQLIATTADFLGDSYEYTGKSDRDIKVDTIQTIKPDFKADEASEEYINGFYESLVNVSDSAMYTADAAFGKPSDKTKDKENEEEIEKMKKERLNLNKKKEEK